MKTISKVLLATSAIAVAGHSIAWNQGGHHQHGCDQNNASESQAQRYENRSERISERKLERIAKRLGLSDEQQGALKTVFEAGQEQRAALHDKQDELKASLQSLTIGSDDYVQALSVAKQQAADLAVERIDQAQAMRKSVAEILTEEQLNRFEEMRASRTRGKHHF